MTTFEDLQRLISPKFTPEVLQGILRKESGANDVKITAIELGAESKKGDSYLSSVVRFSIRYTSNEKGDQVINMIAKALPSNLGRRKTLRSTDFFENECIFYNDVWPAMDAFQKSKKVKNLFDNVPNCLIAYADGANDYIIMENLTQEGFGTAGRESGLDVNHVKLILSVFARFHAIALAYKDQKPDEFVKVANTLKETYFAEKYRTWYTKFQKSLINVVLDAVKKELPEEYYTKLSAVYNGPDFYGNVCKQCATHDSLAVVTHGDAWVPNFLMRYDEQGSTPLKAIMIDFQLTRFASLSTDILFFIYCCTDQSLREAHFDELIEYYHSCFVDFIKELGSSADLLTLDKLKSELKAYGIFAIGMSTEAVTMSLLDDDDVADFDQIENDEGVPIYTIWIVKTYEDETKRKRIAHMVKHMIDYGII